MTIERTSEKLGGKRDPYEWAKKYLKEVPETIVPQEQQKGYENTNIHRKLQGFEIDKSLELVPCDLCGEKTLELKMIPMDLGEGLQYVYHCSNCLLGKTPNDTQNIKS